MEQRKLLLIIVTITIVIAAIIAVGIWLYYPRNGARPGLADPSGSLEWEAGQQNRRDSRRPGLEITEPEKPDDGDFVITLGVPETDPAPSGRSVTRDPAPGPAPGPAAQPPRQAPAPADRAPPRTTAPPPAGSPSPAPAPARNAVPPAPADRAYWVQVISSPNRGTIERARETLTEHQLGARIVTKEIDGRTYYRLRLGPFAVRSEAEKFLGWVNTIDGFSDAMIFVDFTAAASLDPPR